MESEKCPLCNSSKTAFHLTDYKHHKYNKCTKCHLVFRKDLEKFDYQNDQHWTSAIDPDGTKRDLTKDREFKIKNWYGEIIPFVNQHKEGTIIDIGCGLGYLLSGISSKWEKYGVEISNFAIAFIKKEFPEINIIDSLSLNEDEPPENLRESFDVVTCYHVIEHVENPSIFFKNLSMLVKPGGILIVGTPNMGSFAAKRFEGNFRLLGDDGHVCLFNSQNLSELFTRNDFTIKKNRIPLL